MAALAVIPAKMGVPMELASVTKSSMKSASHGVTNLEAPESNMRGISASDDLRYADWNRKRLLDAVI